jgi:hypothetical protein
MAAQNHLRLDGYAGALLYGSDADLLAPPRTAKAQAVQVTAYWTSWASATVGMPSLAEPTYQ